jgi:hypothetical protein
VTARKRSSRLVIRRTEYQTESIKPNQFKYIWVYLTTGIGGNEMSTFKLQHPITAGESDLRLDSLDLLHIMVLYERIANHVY